MCTRLAVQRQLLCCLYRAHGTLESLARGRRCRMDARDLQSPTEEPRAEGS